MDSLRRLKHQRRQRQIDLVARNFDFGMDIAISVPKTPAHISCRAIKSAV